MFYKNDDYTVRIENVGGCEKYYIKFHGQSKSPEVEITYEIFIVYLKEFNKPMERQRNERRRHIDMGELEASEKAGKLKAHGTDGVDGQLSKIAIDAVLRTCTPIQQRRFELHHVHGYTLEEIAKMENCTKIAVFYSVKAVEEKIKNHFS
jgi:hypothetical protein